MIHFYFLYIQKVSVQMLFSFPQILNKFNFNLLKNNLACFVF